jgi:mannose/cellobiose epimerase-like protein (N-acyl-D-glucosamine 2-epimerase family)
MVETSNKERLVAMHATLHSQLYNSVMPFWEKHSIDEINGGFYNNLDIDGKIYDKKKQVWL